MRSFLVESYLPGSENALEQASGHARRAADLAASDGLSIRYLRTTLLGPDETCFHMFSADSLETVQAALGRVGLTADRIVPALEANAKPGQEGAI